MAKQKFVMATFVSRSWEWRGFGKTEDEARQALEAAIDEHCNGSDCIKEDFYTPDDVGFLEFSMGDGFRDDLKMN